MVTAMQAASACRGQSEPSENHQNSRLASSCPLAGCQISARLEKSFYLILCIILNQS